MGMNAVHWDTIIQVTLGGMVFDSELKRGVRKKSLSEPNPQKVEMPRNATYSMVIEKAVELYFEDFKGEDEVTNDYVLCDSSGIVIPVKEQSAWSLGSFYQKNSLQPSRYKLYVAVNVVSYVLW